MSRIPLGAGKRIFFRGGAGRIESVIDVPPGPASPHGVALVAHPHPVYGGTLDNKVAQTWPRRSSDWAGWR